MTYVLSDPHGEYQKYKKMLKLINFSEEDTLYILGDICDRGGESARIYLDVMARENVFVIKGNHEEMAQEHLGYLLEKYHGQGIDTSRLLAEFDLWLWFENGGENTVKTLFDESEEDRLRILEFIKSLPYYLTVDVKGKHYMMVHGGLGDFREGDRIEGVKCSDLVWSRPEFDRRYFEDENTFLIVGHTPTFLLKKEKTPATIYHGKGNVIAIDCGAAYSEYYGLGRLGCLCLDTGEEFYI